MAERFAPTRWSLVQAAGSEPGPQARAALESLCESYWGPLYGYVRRRGYARDEAQDLTQEFFHRLLQRDDLRLADPTRGRFRSFLLTSLRNFLANEWKASQAIKRGGGVTPMSLDLDSVEARLGSEVTASEAPEDAFQREWATTLLSGCLDALRTDYYERGRGVIFDALVPCLSPGDGAPYAELAAQLELSAGAVKVAVHRLRQRYRDTLRKHIAETVANDEELEDEIHTLFRSFHRG